MSIERAYHIKENISNSHLQIYDEITPGDINLWYEDDDLEKILYEELVGKCYQDLPPRTRSKRINEDICKALGYPVPKSFKKTNPRFVGQNFDKYAQQRTNLQIWNEEISPTRRYCIIILSPENLVLNVKVYSGNDLQKLDTTGKLTQKYQAKILPEFAQNNTGLLSTKDTVEIEFITKEFKSIGLYSSPSNFPQAGELMPLSLIYEKLSSLIGQTIDYQIGKERVGGNVLQDLVYKSLGYSLYSENGQLPDVLHQLLEVKRQTSPTIDLGLFLPDSSAQLPIPAINSYTPLVSDIRYAIFYGEVLGNHMTIKNFYLVTGKDFFSFFRQFQGNTVNTKLQLLLPFSLWT